MKKLAILAITFFGTTAVFAQTEKKVEKEKITKDVRIEETNGVRTLKITTTSGGTVTEEVYTGAEVDAKLKEIENLMVEDMQTTPGAAEKTVELTDENGVKTLRIKTTENGKTTEEVYIGEDADKKLKEMELDSKVQKTEHTERKRIEIKETHNE